MKSKTFLTVLALTLMVCAFGQKPAFELTFTAIENTTHVHFSGIKIINRTQGGELAMYWPDTVLILNYLGINEMDKESDVLLVFQNYPNPALAQTTITLFIPQKDQVAMIITDMLGRQVINTMCLLDRGFHSFRFIPGEGNLYFFTANWRGSSCSIKILHPDPDAYGTSSLEYIGHDPFAPELKSTETYKSFPFSPGDELLFIGYTDTHQTGILDAPKSDKSYIFQFATNIPCPETPTVTYEGQVYNTIQIFSQCWLKENLNVGTMITGDQDMTDNGIIEKYCYNYSEGNCTLNGGLYQWNEMMKYTTTLGAPGICPPGWHIPSSEEWKVLEGSVDSLYGIGDPVWDNGGYRGYDAGTNLKSISGWVYGGNGTDLYGFSGLAGGRCSYGSYGFSGAIGFWWTSRAGSPGIAWSRELVYANSGVTIDYDFSQGPAYSVRCVKDD